MEASTLSKPPPFKPPATFTNKDLFFIKKRSPKYLHKISLTNSLFYLPGAIRRIKALKTLRSLTSFKESHIEALHALIFQLTKPHKRSLKHISGLKPSLLKHFPYINNFTLNTLDKYSWRQFFHSLNFQSLVLRLVPHSNNQFAPKPMDFKSLDQLKWRLMNQLRFLKNLQNFTLEFNRMTEPLAFMILAKLDEKPKLVGRLSTLSLIIKYEGPSLIYDVKLNPMNVIKQISELNFQAKNLNNLPVFLKDLGKMVNLRTLRLKLSHGGNRKVIMQGGMDFFDNEEFHSSSSESEEENQNLEEESKENKENGKFSKLVSVKQLENLKDLSIEASLSTTELLEDFLQSFCLPKGVSSVRLDMYDFAWERIIPYKVDSKLREKNTFDDYQIYQEFLTQWDGLENLRCLKLSLNDQSRFLVMNDFFSVPILKKLKKLEIFEYDSSVEDLSETSRKIPMDLKYFFEGLAMSRETLTTLNITDFAISLRRFDENFFFEFPKLDSIIMNGSVFGDENLGKFLGFLSKDKGQGSAFTLVMNQLIIDNDESFKGFLSGLLSIKKNLTISIFANIKKVSSASILKSLDFYLDNAKIDGGFSLMLTQAKTFKAKDLKIFNRKVHKNKIFTSLLVISKMGRLVVDTRYPEGESSEEESDENESDDDGRSSSSGGSNNGHMHMMFFDKGLEYILEI